MPRNKKATGYGAAPGRRNTAARSAKQVTRRQRRRGDARVAEALDAAEQERVDLEARIARERVEPAVGPAPGAAYPIPIVAPPVAQRADPPTEPRPRPNPILAYKFVPAKVQWDGSEDVSDISDARRLLKDGYRIDAVMRRTGVGYKYLDDLPIRTDGRIDFEEQARRDRIAAGE